LYGTGVPGWATDIKHPTYPGPYCVLEDMIEPIQFDFDKEVEEEELTLLVPEFIFAR
jgi:hypothetical protein